VSHGVEVKIEVEAKVEAEAKAEEFIFAVFLK
jgi:hypothetical protein